MKGDNSEQCSRIIPAAAAAKKHGFGVSQSLPEGVAARAWSTGKAKKLLDYREVIALGKVIAKVMHMGPYLLTH